MVVFRRRSATSARAVSVGLSDAGISLVEVVVALFVLMTMSLGLLPMLLGSAKSSAVNKDLVAATSYANLRVAEIRDAFPDTAESTCTQLTAREAANVVDPAGTGLKATIEVADCPTSYPDAVVVTVTVRSLRATNPLVVLNTQIVVTQA